MKKVLKSLVCVLMMSVVLGMTVFAAAPLPVETPSELLPEGVRQDQASEAAMARRGNFFARADLIISNEGSGKVGALAKAYMDKNVDWVSISIYLDRYDESNNRWIAVDSYDAEFYAKDYPSGLSSPSVNIVFKKQKKGYYYRLRGAFSASYNGAVEGFSPTTDAILLD